MSNPQAARRIALWAIELSEFDIQYCCEILKYSQVYEPYRGVVGQERGRTHRDLNERRKIN